MTEFERGEVQGLVRAAGVLASVAERLDGSDLMHSMKAFLYSLRTEILQMAYADGARGEVVTCSRCRQLVNGSRHAWAYGTKANGTMCESCFAESQTTPRPWVQTNQRPHEWMRGDDVNNEQMTVECPLHEHGFHYSGCVEFTTETHHYRVVPRHPLPECYSQHRWVRAGSRYRCFDCNQYSWEGMGLDDMNKITVCTRKWDDEVRT